MEYDEDSKTPYVPEEGIRFKGGRVFGNKISEIRAFEKFHGVALPEDFIRLIGEYSEGYFDHWYEVLKTDSEEIVWTSLLLMELPDDDFFDVHREIEAIAGHSLPKKIVHEIMGNNYSLFFDSENCLYRFPFGEADRFSPKQRGEHGFLTFRTDDAMSIEYISITGKYSAFIASTFEAMMCSSRHYCAG